MGIVAAAVIVMAGVMLSAGGGGTGGGGGGVAASDGLGDFSADPTATVRAVTAEATASLDLYSTQDYEGVYDRLADADRARVSKDEWLARSSRVESTLGTMTAYEVGDAWYLDPDRSIVAVDISASFSNLDEPWPTTWFFVVENGDVTRTMLWGREATYTPEPVR